MIVHHFLGDCGWLWVIVGDGVWVVVIVHNFLGDCGWLWVIVAGVWLIVHHFLCDCG